VCQGSDLTAVAKLLRNESMHRYAKDKLLEFCNTSMAMARRWVTGGAEVESEFTPLVIWQ
jgi:hypothetical protein